MRKEGAINNFSRRSEGGCKGAVEQKIPSAPFVNKKGGRNGFGMANWAQGI